MELVVRGRRGPSRAELLVKAAERNGIPRRMAEGMGEDPPEPAQDPTSPTQVLPVAAGLLQATAFRAFSDAKGDTVVRAVSEWTKVTGGRAPEKVSVTAEDTLRQKYEAMSGEERCAWLRGEIQSLTEMLADEERKLGIVQSTNATQLQEQSECGTDEQGTR